ncbi:MAG: hypothetical protein ACRD2L_22610 [Terriglobia bacterium]
MLLGLTIQRAFGHAERWELVTLNWRASQNLSAYPQTLAKTREEQTVSNTALDLDLGAAFSGAKNNRFSQQPHGLLRRNGVAIEASASFKACNLGELGHDLDVPVVEVIQGFGDRRGVNDEIVGRMIQHPVNPQKRRLQDARQVLILPLLRFLKTRIVRLWEQLGFKRTFLIFDSAAKPPS